MPIERKFRQQVTVGLLVSLYVFSLHTVQGGKLLVVPVDGSHWISMKPVAEELGQRGHTVVVVIPEISLRMGPSRHYTTKTFPVPYTQDRLTELQDMQKMLIASDMSTLEKALSIISFIQTVQNFSTTTCESMLFNQDLMRELKEQEFDAVLTDPVFPCGAILAEYLSIPSIYMLRGIPCSLDFRVTQCPSPPSFVPRLLTRNTDHMTFPQHCLNFLTSLLEPLLCKFFFFKFDNTASALLQRDVTVAEIMSRASVWLMRIDFAFDFPRPLMPNIVLIGGINCAVRKSLPLEVEKFVNSSGEHGFVVFTMGSMVSEMPLEKATQFVDAFRRIPQKVLWRYTGPTPDNLPDNLKLMKWLPQNDLLGHPKVKAFITHGGTHGIYEGICNGVPMVMLPLFGDQPDNVHRMVTRKVGVSLNIQEMTSNTLLEAVNTVIHDKSYKENMMKLSAVHKDRPVEPLDLAVFWTEFVMRHKGAEHLRPAAHDLNWIQYHSLDVIGLLVAVVIISSAMMVKCCTFCFKKCCRSSTSLKKKAD
ncbi:UDP-glucuronosyltransferase 1-6 isoform X1 [Amia ocellicauda]|uniref:UDP-glucuronosyltransferase 1-6 isoform X1 n=1 Tax=Amia ocellicauda TaxID=2972642 RepID=UPI0034643DB9